MKTTTTPIIPSAPTFAKINGKRELNKEAICVFAATGFFLDQDTYWKDEVVLRPGQIHKFDENSCLENSTPYFKWHYTPQEISFEEALDQFTALFEKIVDEQVQDKKVILALSGGLDSRSQAAALHYLGKKVSAYSYRFDGGYSETKLARSISEVCQFSFQEFTIKKGYLWDKLEELARINGCYSEFTHPRQMAIIDEYEAMGELFSLGHWGDVLFDKGAPSELLESQLLPLILKKVVKKGGMELAQELWQHWKLSGTFQAYLSSRIQVLLDAIEIEHIGAKMRAFKSMYWAPRWTATNLAVFSEARPISLPYFDNRMCEFICTIPEAYLADRKLQIAYINKRSRALAKITWQDHKPYNLLNYHKNKSPQNLPYRLGNKLRRETKALFGKPYIQRNWELQFLGEENEKRLEGYLFGASLTKLVDRGLIERLYKKFKDGDSVYYSHSVSMLLTLALKMEQLSSE